MGRPPSTYLIAVAFSRGGDVINWSVSLKIDQVEQLKGALNALRDLGHVAAFAIRHSQSTSWMEVQNDLRSRCGGIALDACMLGQARSDQPQPTFLMPVWAFDHELDGAPASTGQFLGLDLELIATPSSDDELGAHLPGRAGRWFIHARPLF